MEEVRRCTWERHLCLQQPPAPRFWFTLLSVNRKQGAFSLWDPFHPPPPPPWCRVSASIQVKLDFPPSIPDLLPPLFHETHQKQPSARR